MSTQLRPLKAARQSLPTQAQQYLRDLIHNGTYQPGEQLPSQGELAEQLGISRPTLREALHNLELDGIIIRKHGVGTFIAPTSQQRIESGLEALESIEHLANRIGLKTQMGEAVIEERAARPAELAAMSLTVPVTVLSVNRVILVDTQPVAYLQDILPTYLLSKEELLEQFRGSILDVLLKRGSPTLSYSQTRIEAVSADAALAKKLSIKTLSPLLKFEARLYNVDGVVVDYSNSHFVPGYFSFHVLRRISDQTA